MTRNQDSGMAKPPPHGSSRLDKRRFEHEDITDNRLVWEVLEEE